MIDWALVGELSRSVPGAIYWAEKMAVSDLAVYRVGAGYTIRDMVMNAHIAGPFDSFEAACAAYEMLKNA